MVLGATQSWQQLFSDLQRTGKKAPLPLQANTESFSLSLCYSVYIYEQVIQKVEEHCAAICSTDIVNSLTLKPFIGNQNLTNGGNHRKHNTEGYLHVGVEPIAVCTEFTERGWKTLKHKGVQLFSVWWYCGNEGYSSVLTAALCAGFYMFIHSCSASSDSQAQ